MLCYKKLNKKIRKKNNYLDIVLSFSQGMHRSACIATMLVALITTLSVLKLSIIILFVSGWNDFSSFDDWQQTASYDVPGITFMCLLTEAFLTLVVAFYAWLLLIKDCNRGLDLRSRDFGIEGNKIPGF